MLIFSGNNNCTFFIVCDSEPPEKEYATKAVVSGVIHSHLGDILVEGSLFRYTCVENYYFSGKASTQCQGDGTWSSAGNCYLSEIKTYI